VSEIFEGKRLLITGGTGSFGRALLERVVLDRFDEIRVFSRDEKKQEDLRNQFKNKNVNFVIGDTRVFESVFDALEGVDFVFHAAALKQVPSCEFFPMEAVRTNILGSENVIRAARARNVKKVVVLSTDKAVYPINAMGLSKAMMERVMVASSRSLGTNGPILCATRYGNVMGSRGSVIPLFMEQIRRNEPLTVTDPSMTRFLMTLSESVDLVLHAFKYASQGDIFVQKSPAASIGDLAEAVGLIMKRQPQIKYIGTRHGEKLFETLVSREEMARAVSNERHFRVSSDMRDLNYEKYESVGASAIDEFEDYTSHNTKRLTISEIVKVIGDARLVETID